MASPAFASSNKMFNSVLKKLKQLGMDKSEHYPPISATDLDKIHQPTAFNQNSPKELQQKVFFDIQYNFARRGGENLRALRKSAFKVKIDEDGYEFVESTYNEFRKQDQTSKGPQPKPRMYGTNDETCPVQSFKKYISKLHPKCDDFYVKAIDRKDFSTENNTVWFTSKPLGPNKLADMMPSISLRLGLSIRYTNHSIRGAVVTTLSREGFEARQIMRVTAHHCESSLRSYDLDNTTVQKRLISQALAGKRRSTSIRTATVTSNELGLQDQNCQNMPTSTSNGTHRQQLQAQAPMVHTRPSTRQPTLRLQHRPDDTVQNTDPSLDQEHETQTMPIVDQQIEHQPQHPFFLQPQSDTSTSAQNQIMPPQHSDPHQSRPNQPQTQPQQQPQHSGQQHLPQQAQQEPQHQPPPPPQQQQVQHQPHNNNIDLFQRAVHIINPAHCNITNNFHFQ